MVGTCEDDAGLVVDAGGFVEIDDTLDVGLADDIPGCFDRLSAQVKNAVAARDQGVDRRLVGKIGLDHLLVGARGAEAAPVRDPDNVGKMPEPVAADRAEAAGGPRDEQSFEHEDVSGDGRSAQWNRLNAEMSRRSGTAIRPSAPSVGRVIC